MDLERRFCVAACLMSDFAAYAMKLPILLLIAAVLPSAGTPESATPAMDVIGIWQATRVAHRNAPDYGICGLLDFWQIFGKTVF